MEKLESIKAEAEQLLKDYKLSSRPNVAANQKQALINKINEMNFIEEAGKLHLADENGQLLWDEHGHIPLRQVMKEAAEALFEPLDLPQTHREYAERLRDKNITPAERSRLVEHWQATHPEDLDHRHSEHGRS